MDQGKAYYVNVYETDGRGIWISDFPASTWVESKILADGMRYVPAVRCIYRLRFRLKAPR